MMKLTDIAKNLSSKEGLIGRDVVELIKAVDHEFTELLTRLEATVV